LLPPGTLAALKGHVDAIVIVVLAAGAMAALTAGANAPGVATVTFGLGIIYHIRCTAAERHKQQMEQQKLDKAALDVEVIKARHRDLLQYEQPSLSLEHKPRVARQKPKGA
jgi:hypothetical protein